MDKLLPKSARFLDVVTNKRAYLSHLSFVHTGCGALRRRTALRGTAPAPQRAVLAQRRCAYHWAHSMGS